MTKKECPVCILLNPDSDFKNYIDTLLKRDTKISEVIVELTNRNYSVPSEHYLKKHKINCLKDFKVELPQPTPSLTNKQNFKNEETIVNALNISEELEKYRNMSFQEKKDDHIKRLNEIKFMSSIVIHYQLVHGRNAHKATVPKEDIGALKQVEDILQVLTANSFDKEEIPEININICDTSTLNDSILSDYDFPDLKQLENIEDQDDEDQL